MEPPRKPLKIIMYCSFFMGSVAENLGNVVNKKAKNAGLNIRNIKE
jgi:hypothetical protein